MLVFALFFCSCLFADEKAIGIEEAIGLVPAQMQTPGRYALIIGVSTYEDKRISELGACVNDARGIYSALTDPAVGMFSKEDVTLLLNESVTERNVVASLDKIAAKAGTDDLVVVFFSGHGVVDSRGRSYWVMHDTDLSSLRATALPRTELTDLFEYIRTSRLVTLIDSCYSAATADMEGTKAALDINRLYPKFTGKGRVAITASDGDQLSVVIKDKEHSGFGYSAFSWHLIEALKGVADSDLDAVVTVGELWDYVKDRTEATARAEGGDQQPQLKGKIGSKFMLTVNGRGLIENLRKKRQAQKLLEKRLDKIEQYYIDGQMSLKQFNLGRKLITGNRKRYNEIFAKKLEAFISLADGDYTLGQFARALNAAGEGSSDFFVSSPDGLWKVRSGGDERLLIDGDRYICYRPQDIEEHICTIQGRNLTVGAKSSKFYLESDTLTIVPEKGAPRVYLRADYEMYKQNLEKAALFFSAKSWESGIEAADKALKINPYSPEAMEIKSDIVSAEKQEKIERLLEQTNVFKSNENYTLALAAVNDMLNLAPGNTKAVNYRKELQTLKVKAETVSRLLTEARNLQRKAKFKDALKALDKLLVIDPENIKAKRLRVEVADQLKVFETKQNKRFAELWEVVTLNDNPENGKKAMTALDELLKLDPGNPAALAKKKKIEAYYAPVLGFTITNSIGMKLVLIPAGEFVMGSDGGDLDEKPARRVKISEDFFMGACEVTQAQYKEVMGNNPSKFKPFFGINEDHPVERVSFDDAMEFCRKLSAIEGREYTLPTEAQWEYACRGGRQTRYTFGNSESKLDEYGWYSENSDDKTHKAGVKKANSFGLYDMHGNVWEWCIDWYDSGFYNRASSPDPVNRVKSDTRVLRGGCWEGPAGYCRSANRYWCIPGYRGPEYGFRVIMKADEKDR